LSGGEQQRVAIARALAKAAPLLLADEPTGELDFRTGVQILDLLRQQAEVGKAVIAVTHNREIARIADRVVELRDGQVASDGPPKNGRVSVSELMW
jgi:putative ABC transport system ATP-binding protein